MISRRQAFSALTSLLPAGSLTAEDEEKSDVGELVKLLADALQHLRLTSPPIGSVQAFAGGWLPPKVNGVWTELDIGWLLCDGRKLADVQKELHAELEKQRKKIPEDGILAELRAVLPQIEGKQAENLPDYRGYFLRGLDRGITGLISHRDQGEKREVGQDQAFATAVPKTEFQIATAKSTLKFGTLNHSYGQINNAPAEYLVKNENGTYTHSFEHHTHQVQGGDVETRPVNIAVNYIIKFQ